MVIAEAAIIGGSSLAGALIPSLLGGGSDGVPRPRSLPAPEFSDEERALINRQLGLLDRLEGAIGQQRNDAFDFSQFIQDTILEMKAREQNFRRALEGFEPETPQERQVREAFEVSTLDILRGEFKDPILERNIELRQRETDERLRRQFGPGFETGTVGIQTLAEESGAAERARFGAKESALLGRNEAALGRSQFRREGELSRLNLLQGNAQFPAQLLGIRALQPGQGNIDVTGLRTLLGATQAPLSAFSELRNARTAAAAGDVKAINRQSELNALRRSQLLGDISGGISRAGAGAGTGLALSEQLGLDPTTAAIVGAGGGLPIAALLQGLRRNPQADPFFGMRNLQ